MADVNIDPETKDCKQLFNQGVKAFVLRDYKNAVDALGRATELMVADLKGDDLHDSLGDPYLYYGKALLALYRQESDPIGTLPKQLETSGIEDQEAEDEEADNEENEEKDESVDNTEETEKNGSESSKNGDEAKNGKEATNGDKANEEEDEKPEEMEEDDEDALKVDEAEKSANPNESFLELEPKEPEADEEPTDLQVAWEVLELAKKIFQKRGDDGKKSYAETLTTLGEISLESENYTAAVTDFKEALDIQVEIFPKDSRKVAETYYNLGVSYASNTCYKEGITHLQKSIEYLEKRIRNLEANEEVSDEIQEMKDLIPEIYERIGDLKSFTDEVCCDHCQCLDKLTVTFHKAKVREVLRNTYESLKANHQDEAGTISNYLGTN